MVSGVWIPHLKANYLFSCDFPVDEGDCDGEVKTVSRMKKIR